MSKDQLLKKFEKKDEKFTALKSDYKKLNQEFDVLKRNFQEMEIAYNKLLKEYDKKNFTIKKFNHEKFCSKAENLNKTKIVIHGSLIVNYQVITMEHGIAVTYGIGLEHLIIVGDHLKRKIMN